MKQKLRDDMILPLNKVYRLETGECLYDYEGKKVPGNGVGYFLIDYLGSTRHWRCGGPEEGLAICLTGDHKGTGMRYTLYNDKSIFIC